jgi:type I restriction enzyme S subunit
VLQAAVTGRLTEAWRKQHGPPQEPGPKLLERILAERRRLWEERTQAKYERAGKQPPKNWRNRYPEPFPPGTLAHGAALPSLPDSWCWATHDQVGDVQLGRQRAPEHHTGSHVRPYLRVANVYEDRIDTSDVLQMNFTPEEFETYELRHGDILLNEGQSMELVGRPAMYRGELPGGCFQNTLVRQRAIDPLLPEFALIVCLAQFRGGRFRKIASITTSIAHLGAQRFAALEFPLPPLAEQEVIVETVKEKLSLIDALTIEVQRGRVRAGRLRQSILKAAFEGKLVPQDPADEPASELLSRIQAQQSDGRYQKNRGI